MLLREKVVIVTGAGGGLGAGSLQPHERSLPGRGQNDTGQNDNDECPLAHAGSLLSSSRDPQYTLVWSAATRRPWSR